MTTPRNRAAGRYARRRTRPRGPRKSMSHAFRTDGADGAGRPDMVDWDLAVRDRWPAGRRRADGGPRRGGRDRRGAPRGRGPLDRAGARVHRAGGRATTRRRCWSSTGPAGCRPTPTRSRRCSHRSWTSSPRRSRRRGITAAIGSRVTGAEVGALLGFLASQGARPVRPVPRARRPAAARGAQHRARRARARGRPARLPALGLPARGDPPGAVHRGAVDARAHVRGRSRSSPRPWSRPACSRTASPGSSRGSRTPAPADRQGAASSTWSARRSRGSCSTADRRDVAARGPRRRRHGRRRPDASSRRWPRSAPSSTSAARASASSTGSCAGCSASTPRWRSTATAPRSSARVVDKAGMAGFNAVWEQPDHLPTQAPRSPTPTPGWRACSGAERREPPPLRRRGPGRRTPDPGRARGRAARPGAAAGRRRAGRVLRRSRTRSRCSRRRSSRGTSSACG